MTVLHGCMLCLTSAPRGLSERACVTAAGRRNEMYSPAYASPEIIAQMHGVCEIMAEQPNDLWALGVTLHQVFTCASRSWQTAFGSAVAGGAMCTERMIQKALIEKQAVWVRVLDPPLPPHDPFLPPSFMF